MGYMHIENLYKNQDILYFKECYALEKIHGTSAHLKLKDGKLYLHAGGVSAASFAALFPEQAELAAKIAQIVGPEVTIYGEAYGGSCQKMSHVYGKSLKFVAFEVRVGETWLNVNNAADICDKLGLDFVDFSIVPTTIEDLNAERDKDSTQALRNGMGAGKMREGVVLRSLIEVTKSNGDRIIAKHKRDDFKETASPREVVPLDKQKILDDAEAIALEWVTPMRLQHVLDKLGPIEGSPLKIIPRLIEAMSEDVLREAKGEIVDDGKTVSKAINARTVKLYKESLEVK